MTTVDTRQDGDRLITQWRSCGINFVSNVISRVGASIPLHSHSYAHEFICTHGMFVLMVNGVYEGIVASKDFPYMGPTISRGIIPAFAQHTFILRETHNGQPAEILCMWGVGTDGFN